jgi:hypothetical protein
MAGDGGRAGEQVIEGATGSGAKQGEKMHRLTAAGLAPTTRPGTVPNGATPHTPKAREWTWAVAQAPP